MPRLKPDHVSPEPPKVPLTQEQFYQIVASSLVYFEIEEQYGEEVAINVAIARDPEDSELDDEWFKRARPAKEVDPALVDWWERSKTEGMPPAKEIIAIRLDHDVINHFKATGPDWHSHVNAILRQAAFGPQNPD